MKKILVLSILITVCFCSAGFFNNQSSGFHTIPHSQQRSGDPQKGYEYILSAAYMQSGLPFYLYQAGFGKRNTGYLKDHDPRLGYDFNFTTAKNGNAIVAPTCFQCHAEKLNNELVIGLGNNSKDFTSNQVYNIKPMQNLLLYYLRTLRPKEYEAAYRFSTATQLLDTRVFTDCRGVNAADRLFALLVSYRDPVTLAWRNTDALQLESTVIPSDVPAWWLMKKKNAIYYSGEGRGDFGKFMLSSALLTMTDSADASEIDKHMPDVLSYIRSLEPPPYPGSIDQAVAAEGHKIFTANCSSCHGTYGDNETYPNKLIPAGIIGTDPWLSHSNFGDPSVISWFNNSWFSQGGHPAKLEPFDGYIAPPLDGIWATAPYLHNGSVPELEMVINSAARPTYWKRGFGKHNYNVKRAGLRYKKRDGPGDRKVYNTELPGYSNAGHLFGDHLTENERKELLEYLKTL